MAARYKNKVRVYKKKNKSHVRDFWIEEIRHTHMSYISENKKKRIPRKAKYKDEY